MTLHNDMARCTGEQCPTRDKCARYNTGHGQHGFGYLWVTWVAPPTTTGDCDLMIPEPDADEFAVRQAGGIRCMKINGRR